MKKLLILILSTFFLLSCHNEPQIKEFEGEFNCIDETLEKFKLQSNAKSIIELTLVQPPINQTKLQLVKK